MSDKQKNKLIPKLRFPEFKDSGEWVEKVLFQVANYENGNAHEKNIDENGEYIVVNSKYISSDGETVKYSNKAFCLAEQGDILMVLSDVPNGKAIAKCFYVPVNNKYTVNQRICKISPYDCDNKFLIYILNRNKYFLAFDDGVKQTNLKKDDVLNAPLLLPKDIPEQQKIADFLSNLDELIEAHKQKLELLKRHKKGLMQNLFPHTSTGSASGEKVPKYRFPEFRDSGEWVEKKLGQVCNTISSGKDKKQENGEFDLYGSTGIIGKTRNASYNGKFILIARVGANAGLLNMVVDKFGVTDNTLVVNLKETEKVDFIFYLLNNSGLNSLIFGSGQPLVTGKQLKELIIKTPTIQEQQKIASCLSSVDEIITAEAEKIEQLEKHKKGLMQGVFPQLSAL